MASFIGRDDWTPPPLDWIEEGELDFENFELEIVSEFRNFTKNKMDDD